MNLVVPIRQEDRDLIIEFSEGPSAIHCASRVPQQYHMPLCPVSVPYYVYTQLP
jgi:hypothetical protein